MNDKTLELLTRVAEQLGTTVEYVLELAAQRVFVESVVAMCVEGIVLIVLIPLALFCFSQEDDESKLVGVGLAGISLLLVILISFDIVKLFTLEYSAIKMVLGMITS